MPYTIAVLRKPGAAPDSVNGFAKRHQCLRAWAALRNSLLVMITDVVYGVAPSHLVATRLLGAFVLLLMLVLELVLNFLAAPVATRQITARL